MIRLFPDIKGNSRAMVLFEPLFSIPMGLVGAYSAMYARAMGLDPVHIGLLGSIGSAVAIVSSLVGGYVTDRFGRRKTLLAFDIIGWTLPIILWMVARNFWFFFGATLLNACSNMGRAAHNCLIVEDTSPEERRPVFAAMQTIGILSGFFVPLAGLTVAYLGLVPAVRVMYAVFLISGTSMILLRYSNLRESKIGIRRMEDASKDNWVDGVKDYVKSGMELAKNRVAMGFLLLEMLLAIKDTAFGTFDAIYINSVIKVPTEWIAAFPTLASLTQLAVLQLSLHGAKRLPEKKAIRMGLVLATLGVAVYLTASPGRIFILGGSTILTASAVALLRPALSSSWSNAIPDHNRAKLTSVYYLMLSLARVPAAWLAGVLYMGNPRLPFVFAGILLLLGSAMFTTLIGRSSGIPDNEAGAQEGDGRNGRAAQQAR